MKFTLLRPWYRTPSCSGTTIKRQFLIPRDHRPSSLAFAALLLPPEDLFWPVPYVNPLHAFLHPMEQEEEKTVPIMRPRAFLFRMTAPPNQAGECPTSHPCAPPCGNLFYCGHPAADCPFSWFWQGLPDTFGGVCVDCQPRRVQGPRPHPRLQPIDVEALAAADPIADPDIPMDAPLMVQDPPEPLEEREGEPLERAEGAPPQPEDDRVEGDPGEISDASATSSSSSASEPALTAA